MNKLITVVGPSGIGKTTLVNALARQAPFATALEEHITRPFQALYLQDPHYGLHNQVDYLVLRAEQEAHLRQSGHTALVDGGLDLDFHGFTCLFHRRSLLTDAEFDVCRRLYHLLRSQLPPPDLIIRLHAPQAVVTGRISGRERINIAGAEDHQPFEFLLDAWLTTVSPDLVLDIDVSSHDPMFSGLVPLLLAEIRSRTGDI